jgi:branched-chain amino acid transport system substrate-binding protein
MASKSGNMQNRLSRRALCNPIVILSLAAATAGLVDLARSADDTIKLGIVAPMSEANSPYGAFAMHGAQLAVKEINDAGGVNGKKLQIDTGDSQCAPVEGVSATQRLINEDQVKFIIGDICSS